ncbi:MAG TPA: hypothetical protein VIY86_08410, partial [Pirellulaceae bacterium]
MSAIAIFSPFGSARLLVLAALACACVAGAGLRGVLADESMIMEIRDPSIIDDSSTNASDILEG